MVNPHTETSIPDPTATERKKDHIELAFRSRVELPQIDARFDYEPALSGHPAGNNIPETRFLHFTLNLPLWVSSMTGGTVMASTINANLARACGEFGMGMGLGSCRQLLYSDEYLEDFRVKKYMPGQPLFANLGIAQLELMVANKEYAAIRDLIRKLDADGLIVHINPLQEWLQPEGDRYFMPPVQTIGHLLEHLDVPIIVKEVGQGMGKESLRQLMKLPLAALDFGAAGGTNFALLELLRSDPLRFEHLKSLARVGHTAGTMLDFIHEILAEEKESVSCRQLIISGGITDFLDGYYLIQKSRLPAIYAQASAFLKHATDSYEQLRAYIEVQIQGLSAAYQFLKVR